MTVGTSPVLPLLLLTLLLILGCQAVCEDGGLAIIRLRQGNRDVVEQVQVRAAERRGHLEAAPDPAEGRRILVNDADGTIAELQRFVERSLLRICRDCLVLSRSDIWHDRRASHAATESFQSCRSELRQPWCRDEMAKSDAPPLT